MKYSIKTLTGIFLLLLMVLHSCMDLEEVPLNRISPPTFYKTPDQCQSILIGTMAGHASTWGGHAYHPGWPDGTMDAGLNWAITANTGRWGTHYASINNINPVIKSILDGTLDSYAKSTVDDILAQAYFLRAFNHFTLVRMYGRVLYLDENTPDLISNLPTPESREEVSVIYEKIESDLLKAIALMNPTLDPALPGRPNVWAAKALLARVYITWATAPLKQTAYYAKARDMAEDIITNSPFGFVEDIPEIFKVANVKNNPEFIWGYNSTSDYNLGIGCNFGPDDWGCWSSGGIRSLWADTYPEQPRKYSYVLTTFPRNLHLTDDPAEWIWIPYEEGGDHVPFMGKYCWPNVPREINIVEAPFDPPLPIFRYSDMLLVYAEAANMANGGPTQLAVDRVNMIIDRANKPYTSVFGTLTTTPGTHPRVTMSMSAQEFDDKVMAERVWELCFESETYFDVLRKETLEEVNKPDISLHYEPHRYLFPIPDLDALLIGQTPGYTK